MSKEYVDPATYEFSNLYYKTITNDMQKNIQLDKEAKAIAEENERGYQARKRAEEMTEEVAETPVKPTSTYNNKRKVDSRAFDAPFGYGHTSIKRAENVQKLREHESRKSGYKYLKNDEDDARKSNATKEQPTRVASNDPMYVDDWTAFTKGGARKKRTSSKKRASSKRKSNKNKKRTIRRKRR